MDAIFEEAKKFEKSENIEVFRQEWDSDSVCFEMDRLKQVKSQNIAGFAIRIIHNGKSGFASGTSPDPKDLVGRCIRSTKFGPEAEFQFPEASILKKVKNFDPLIESLTLEELMEKAVRVHDFLKKKNSNLQYDITIERYIETREILSGRMNQSYRRSIYSTAIAAHSFKENDFINIWDSYSCSLMESREMEIANFVLDLFDQASRESKISTGIYPVIFAPKALRELLSSILVGLNGIAVEKGASPLADKMEKKVLPEAVDIFDDGTIDGSSATVPIDDEGVPVERHPLIEGGFVRNFILDLRTSASLKYQLTGNGRREYSRLPQPSCHAVIFFPGNLSIDEMTAGIKKGIYIDQVIGSYSGNPYSGDFQMNVDLGFKIDGGKIGGRVKNTMITGNIYQLFNSLTGISNRCRWVGSYYLPHIRFEKLQLAGK